MKNLKYLFLIIILSVFFGVAPVKTHAAEWSGEIFVNDIAATPTTEAPDFTIKDSTSDVTYLFSVKFTVQHPAIDANNNGNIESSELGSWAAVEASKVEKINGSFYLAPNDNPAAICPGGLCIQISTDKNFGTLISAPSAGYTRPFITPKITETTTTAYIYIKGFKEGVKYYYRFIGEETGPDEHYFPFNPFDKNLIEQSSDYYDGDSNVLDSIKDTYSFTTEGVSAGTFYIEIPKAGIKPNSVEIKVHIPEAQMATVSLFKDSSQIYTDTKLGDSSVVDPAGSGYIQYFNIGVTQKLDPSSQYQVVAKTPKAGVTLPTGPSDFDVIEKTFSTVAEIGTISPSGSTDTNYVLLAPLPGQEGAPAQEGVGVANGNIISVNSAKSTSFGDYLNTLIRLFIGLCAVLAMIMIVIGGIEYMTSELSHSKEEGKERITNAIFGLLIALGAFALLNTINPQLLDVSLSGVTKATVEELSIDEPATAPASNGKYCHSFTENEPWPAASLNLSENKKDPAIRAFLKNKDPTKPVYNISINANDCAKVGTDKHCTSLDGLDTSLVTAVATNCKTSNNNTSCNLQITGGTECWLHNNSARIHYPGDSSVDLEDTPALKKYITGNASFILDGHKHPKDGFSFLAEICGQTKCTTAPHWHVEK